MSLALLAGANPRNCAEGPLVRLVAGNWKIISEGIVDSELALTDYSGTSAKLNGCTKFQQLQSGGVRVIFTKRGTEPFINIHAEHDTESTAIKG